MSKNTDLGNLVNGIYVDSTGKVGVGTTSPSVALDVTGAGLFSSNLTVNGTGNFTTTSSSVYDFSIRNSGTGISRLRFGNATSAARLTLALGATDSEYARFGSEGNFPLHFQTNGTDRLTITGAGNVGIGTSSPATFMHIVGANTTNRGQLSIQSNNSSNAARVSFYYDTTLQGNIGTTGGDFYLESVNNLVTFTGGAERMRITSGGNVGIGTSTPDAKLTAVQYSAAAITTLYGSGNSQGGASNIKIVRHYPVVSSGNKLIIPFYSQGNLNSTTIVRIFGHSAIFNWNIPQAFTADFSVGHLNALYYLTTHSSTGNISGIAINGMNIEISFSSGYTNGTANGVFVTIEYMTNIPGYSIDIANIRMN